jgi:hypothetical protein
MRESWETGRFWLNYAARKSWAFDYIYWHFLDERFLGPRGDVPERHWARSRVDLLTDEEREVMHRLVDIKVEEEKERILVDWEPEEAKRYLAQFLV